MVLRVALRFGTVPVLSRVSLGPLRNTRVRRFRICYLCIFFTRCEYSEDDCVCFRAPFYLFFSSYTWNLFMPLAAAGGGFYSGSPPSSICYHVQLVTDCSAVRSLTNCNTELPRAFRFFRAVPLSLSSQCGVFLLWLPKHSFCFLTFLYGIHLFFCVCFFLTSFPAS